MLHQYEEHDNDRFRRFVNQTIAKGRAGLSVADVFVINVPGVWGVIALSLWLAATFNNGFGLIAAYLVVVNATFHVAGGVILRRYNPGLVTALILFFPIGAYSIERIQRAGGGTPSLHVTGVCAALLIHAAIIAKTMRKESRTPLQDATA
jgi:hypothetical protein